MKLSKDILSFHIGKNKNKEKRYQIINVTYNIKKAVYQNIIKFIKNY